MDDVIDIAKKLRPKSMAVEFSGTVKEVLGTCVSLGCTVDGKSAKEVQSLIDAGEIEVHEWAGLLFFDFASKLSFSNKLRYKFSYI